MDTETLVDRLIDDGQKLVDRLPQDGFDVTAAFWLKRGEDGQWDFYVASPVVEKEGLFAAYRQIHTLIRAMPQPFWIDPLQVKLIGASNPITQDVLVVHGHASGPKVCPIRWGGKQLGKVSIEGAYLYPLPVATSP